MQKKLIVLAVAAVTSGAAFAQSNISIYGTVDMGYLYRGGNNGAIKNNQSSHALQSNSAQSSIGFKGVEDLGNGFWCVIEVEFSAAGEDLRDADVAEFRPHAEVGDAEGAAAVTVAVAEVAVAVADPSIQGADTEAGTADAFSASQPSASAGQLRSGRSFRASRI